MDLMSQSFLLLKYPAYKKPFYQLKKVIPDAEVVPGICTTISGVTVQHSNIIEFERQVKLIECIKEES